MDLLHNFANNNISNPQYNQNHPLPQFTFKYIIYTDEIKKGDLFKKCENNNLYYIKVNINNNADSSLKLSELYISLEDIELDEFEYDKKLNKLISICEVCKFNTQYNY